MGRFQPVIKWSGSKRSQADAICQEVPSFNRYFEPFVGGGSIAYALSPEFGVAGDVCIPLIGLWNLIQKDPQQLADDYKKEWEQLQKIGADHFYVVRERFNNEFAPSDLLFLSRTCVNGLIRFNSDGKFNNSFHLTRPGINPDRLTPIILDWSHRIRGIEFQAADYRETTESAAQGDFVYLDPPYANTKGRYYGTSTIDFEEFYEFLEDLNKRGIRWALSFDGSRGEKQYQHSLPPELFRRRLLLPSGSSTFRRVVDKQIEEVFESLYLNY
ncbi:DNA adenine methylase [Trueperella pyogenes]|uniref:DNA adenine methylase n=1 Tax=Trueperella pyogenes TaxID=1661 RepID=UPI00143315F7|nr:DNA adenine methylase [Trueperella pyogenes]QIU87370.1 DNA adenine methylase [Trueperella pyogenes]